MRRFFLASTAALLALGASCAIAATRLERGTLSFDNIPEPSSELRERLLAYLGARQARALGFSPQGGLLISTRFADTDQLHLVERVDGARRQLTFLHEPVTQAAFCPDPRRSAYVYLADVGGDEKSQLYYQRLGEPDAKRLTDGKSVNGDPVWSNSGREVAFSSTARDGVSHDIDIVDPESGTLPRLVVSGDSASLVPLDFSPDDRKLLVLKTVSIAEAYLYVVDLGSGEKREVEPAPAKVGIGTARFSRDGQGVYLVSDRDQALRQLRFVNLFTGERTLLGGASAGDVEDLAIARDGHYLAYVVNEGGASKLTLLDLRNHQDLIPPKLPAMGVIDSLSFDAAGTHLALSFSSANRPRDAYVLDIAANRLEQWTHSEAGAVDLNKFLVPRLVQFPTFDRVDSHQRLEPVYVYEPATPAKHPVLIVLHGGPEAQFRPQFDPWIAYLVNELNYAVLAPNVRGSSGYGKDYLALDNGLLREDAVKDVGALLVWIALQNSLDAKHVVVSGASYGGYLTLATLVDFGDRLRGGVDVSGFTDFLSFLANTAPYRRDQRRAEYGDERDPDMRAFLRRASPLTNAERIKSPLLIVQGRNDPRVPASEAEQLVNRLRARGGSVWYLVAADEGHGFRKKANRDEYYLTFAQFLQMLAQ